MAKNAKDYEERPWGNFRILSELNNEGGFKDIIIKRMEINPGKRVSYQKHKLRNEHWYIIVGQGIVTLNDQEIPVKIGESVEIPIGYKHRIFNSHGSEPLVFIEVITGEFDEYDNERLEDDFNRDSAWRNQ